MKYALATAVCAAMLPAVSVAEEQCKAQQDAIAVVANKYKAQYDGYAKEGEDIKSDSATFKFDVTWKDVEIIFDLPSTTIKDQKMVFGVPQTTVKQQDIIFHTPSVRMKRVKVGQHPETTCHDTWITVGFVKTKGVPSCTVTWHDNYADVPEHFMEEQRISMGVPEFKWDDTEIIMGIPEFTMDRQRWVVGLPQFKLVSIAINEQKIKDRSEKLRNDIAETQEHQRGEMIDGVHALFSCNRDLVAQNRSKLSAQFAAGIAQLDSAIQSMQSQGADPANIKDSSGKTVDLFAKRAEVLAARDKALADFEKALKSLDDSEKASVEKMKA